jgi:Lon protease-like protein
MVDYCMTNDMPIGVCHTQKILHDAKPQQSIDEALESNQSTYKPYPVFSAGRCELVETLDDGRLFINVHLSGRYHIEKEIQVLPFGIFSCSAYYDETPDSSEFSSAWQLKEKVLHRVSTLVSDVATMENVIHSYDWKNKDAAVFSFELISVLPLDPSFKQHLLECRSAATRLEQVLQFINRI